MFLCPAGPGLNQPERADDAAGQPVPAADAQRLASPIPSARLHLQPVPASSSSSSKLLLQSAFASWLLVQPTPAPHELPVESVPFSVQLHPAPGSAGQPEARGLRQADGRGVQANGLGQVPRHSRTEQRGLPQVPRGSERSKAPSGGAPDQAAQGEPRPQSSSHGSGEAEERLQRHP